MGFQSTLGEQEVHKFSVQANLWWDEQGPFKTLHDINPKRLEFIQKHAPLASKSVLDVGCGGGILSESTAKSGAIVTGIDASNEAIAVADKHAKAASIAITYDCALVEDYEGQFDVITCFELIEHVANPKLILEHCERLLKPNGFLFLSTLNRTFQAYFKAVVAAEYVLKILPKQTHDYQKFIKPSELLTYAREYSLCLVDMTGLSYNPWSGVTEFASDVSVNYLIALRKTT